tara:strand:+ start:249 stop:398 length:150 start_codon:yes stop_codon:yes gene_type:complete
LLIVLALELEVPAELAAAVECTAEGLAECFVELELRVQRAGLAVVVVAR